MATIYCRFSDGDDANAGTGGWSDAKKTLSAAVTAAGTDGLVYLAKSHAETYTSGTFSVTGPTGKTDKPCRIISVDDTGDPEPPTVAQAGASLENITTAATTTQFLGHLYVRGLTVKFGLSGANSGLRIGYTTSCQYQRWDNCTFECKSSVLNTYLDIGYNQNSHFEFNDCTWYFPNSASPSYEVRACTVVFNNCTWTDDQTGGRDLFLYSYHFNMTFVGCDFSGMSTGRDFFQPGYQSGLLSQAKFINCKMPSSGAALFSSAPTLFNNRASLENSSSGDNHYEIQVWDYYGDLVESTAVYRTNGAKYDGTNGLSWFISTSANAEWPHLEFRSPEIVAWNDTVGSSITATVHLVHDVNAAAGQGSGGSPDYDFSDQEVWLEVQYQGTSGAPMTVFKSESFAADRTADTIGTGADQTDDASEGWTTTGLTTPKKQKLTMSFTPSEIGWVHARVCVGVASKEVYVCPKLELT